MQLLASAVFGCWRGQKGGKKKGKRNGTLFQSRHRGGSRPGRPKSLPEGGSERLAGAATDVYYYSRHRACRKRKKKRKKGGKRGGKGEVGK